MATVLYFSFVQLDYFFQKSIQVRPGTEERMFGIAGAILIEYMPFLLPDQKCQSTEGIPYEVETKIN